MYYLLLLFLSLGEGALIPDRGAEHCSRLVTRLTLLNHDQHASISTPLPVR
jgi:hypothetical protein